MWVSGVHSVRLSALVEEDLGPLRPATSYKVVMGRFNPSVIFRPVRGISASVHQLSESLGNLLETMPTNSFLASLCCFAKEQRRDTIVIAEVLSMTPEEDIDKEELEAKFAELVDELDLSAANRHAMLMLPVEKKWQIYCSRKSPDHPVLSYSPDYYVDRVRAFIPQESPKLFESLKTSLRTEPHSFVQRYLEMDGLEILLTHLRDQQMSHSHSNIIGCLKSLLNNSTGRAHVLAHGEALNIIAQSLAGENPRAKVDALEILGATCLVPGGHRKAMEAISYLQEFTCERTRFQTIITDLDRSTGPYREDLVLKTAIMSFINAILSYGPGQECTEFRLHLRFELLMLGIIPVISKLRTFENLTLDKHLDFFEMMRSEDEKELARRIGTVHVDTTNVDLMFETIKGRWSHSLAFPSLQSILVHLLLIPGEPHWILLDRVLQQIVLYPNTDRIVLALEIEDVVKNLASEADLMNMESKYESAKNENCIVMKRLCETETELEHSLREKERLESQLYQLAQENQRQQYNQQLSAINPQVNNNSSVTSNGLEDSSHKIPPPPISSLLNNNRIGPPPPPLPGMTNGIAPPPPPPPPPGLGGTGSLFPPIKKPKKPVPQASAPLKSFNWSKIPDSKLEGTVWTQIVEEYNDLDLSEVDRLFSAYQKQNGHENSYGTMEKVGKRILSIIDSRRAQNCTILLSKLKMSDDEICSAIISMDSREEIPQDMIEQLLKFTPTLEERSLLEENQMDELARADHFLLKISRISHYEERLFTLYYKKRFNTLTQDLQSKMKTVISACEEVRGSLKLKKVLQMVLSIGNYMNRGQRGNASGFRLQSLTRLADTKSNSKVNLLNYIVGQIETNHKELLEIETEIGNVKGAAKVSLQELEKEMGGLRTGLTSINGEVEFQKTQPVMPGDRFLPVTREFLSTSSGKVEALEKLFSEAKWKFQLTVKHFGEDITQIDEFFAIFDQFLCSFTEARLENEGMRRRKEDEEKKQSTLRRPSRAQNQSQQHQQAEKGTSENKGDFDDLISALRTGDVFSDLNDRGNKRSRSKKQKDFDSRERIH